MAATKKRQVRSREFVDTAHWGGSPLSFHLGVSADTLLAKALDDRRGGVYRVATTHFSPHAIGAIALIVTAFDAFLNEACNNVASSVPRAREVATDASPLRKCSLLLGTQPIDATDAAELELLTDVRHEIIHYLPRPTAELLERLEGRDLLLAAPPPSAWDVGQRLGSYALAFWAFETVERIAARLAATSSHRDWVALSLHENFVMDKRACAPSQLAAFDEKHGLTLTAAS